MKRTIKIVLIIFASFYPEISFCQDTTSATFKISKTIYATIAGKTSGTIKRQLVLDSGKIVLHGCPDCQISGFEMLAIKYSKRPDHVILEIKKSYDRRTGELKKIDTTFGNPHTKGERLKETEEDWRYNIIKSYDKNTGELLTTTKFEQLRRNPNDDEKCWTHVLVEERSNNSTRERTVDTTEIYQLYNLQFESNNEYLTEEMINAIKNQFDITIGGIGIHNIQVKKPDGEVVTYYDNKYLTFYFQ